MENTSRVFIMSVEDLLDENTMILGVFTSMEGAKSALAAQGVDWACFDEYEDYATWDVSDAVRVSVEGYMPNFLDDLAGTLESTSYGSAY